MIVVDASAVLAIHFAEQERGEFTAKLVRSPSIISPVNAWEVLVRAHAVDGSDGRKKAEQLLDSVGVAVVPVDFEVARIAADAFAQFGKLTPARLNLGDCFAYALARQRNAPLLFKGDDFTKTDIVAA